MTQINFFVPIQEYLDLVEHKMRAQSDGHHTDLGAALDHLLTSGGKRVRPAVALLTGNMLGADPDRIVTLGAAIELLHTATLVHDDLIDGALLRRGIATLNARWSPAATVLTGDFVFAQAAKLAAETNSIPVMRLFAETLAIIVNGELTQMFSSHGIASKEDYYQRIYAKTASMFELATAASAMLSPVNDTVIAQMRRFGYQIGMAFQIVDDVLDFTGEQTTIGKPVASDLRQGLITLPALNYIELNPDDKEMRALLDGRFYSDERMNRLVNAIRESGAVEKSNEEARQYIECALETLEDQPDTQEKQALVDIARYIVYRDF
ncbi:MAG TPA: polyprenyl synthetase family protein [Anaerolineales bacterium]|nr:polyprenyl synthetase family protein [Anaerolineales bacterium]